LNNSFRGARLAAIFATDTDGLIEGNTFAISGTGGDVVAISGSGILDIIGNTILSAQAPPEASGHTVTGIVAAVHGGVIANNVIRNLRGAPAGVAILAQGPAVISGNVIVNPPGTGDRGIYCRGPTIVVSNVVMGFATPYLDCPH
jgi:putative cofactor-binding repeat protein